MAFKPWRKRRARGERFPVGFIKRKIALIISSQFPKGIREPDLRDFLREKWGISEPKGVKTHLAELEERKALIKEEKKGFPNVWKLNQDYEAFKSLLKEFHNSEDEIGFLRSKYVQSMINEDFVDHFSVDWWMGYARFFNIQTQKVKSVEKFLPEELRGEFYTRMLGTKKDDLIQIFRVSPTSLHIFLFPEEIFPSLNPGTPLDALFLFSFVADMSIYNVPEGKGISTRLEVEYGDVKKGKNGIKVAPSIKTKAQFGIRNLKGVEEK